MTAPSPFLEGTKHQFAWDSTSLGYLKTCARKYYYQIIEGWRPRAESIHLRFGAELHWAFEAYDKEIAQGIKHDDAVWDVVRELMIRTVDFESNHPKKTRQSLVRTVVWYLDQNKDGPKPVMLRNGKPAVEQTFKFPVQEPYVLCGHLDKIVDLDGAPYVMDYKTRYTFWNAAWEPDNQMTLYSIAGSSILESPVRGVIIDMITFKTKDGEIIPEFKRDITQRTPDQLDEWMSSLDYWFKQAENFADGEYWPMNDTSCDKYGGCAFRSVCSKSPAARKAFLKADFIQEEPWNPLKSR